MRRNFLLHGLLLFLVGLLGFFYGGIFTPIRSTIKPTHMDNRVIACSADGSVVYCYNYAGELFVSKDFGKKWELVAEDGGPEPR